MSVAVSDLEGERKIQKTKQEEDDKETIQI